MVAAALGDTLSSLATEAAFNRETDGVVKYASGKQVYRNSVWISKALCILCEPQHAF